MAKEIKLNTEEKQVVKKYGDVLFNNIKTITDDNSKIDSLSKDEIMDCIEFLTENEDSFVLGADERVKGLEKEFTKEVIRASTLLYKVLNGSQTVYPLNLAEPMTYMLQWFLAVSNGEINGISKIDLMNFQQIMVVQIKGNQNVRDAILLIMSTFLKGRDFINLSDKSTQKMAELLTILESKIHVLENDARISELESKSKLTKAEKSELKRLKSSEVDLVEETVSTK